MHVSQTQLNTRMSKASGGTRNYSGNPKTMAKRESEFQAIVSTGNYKDSYFDKSGGYYVVHKHHNEIADPNTNKEMYAAEVLAKKGYRVYLMSEKSYITGAKKTDGFKEHSVMDMKTINSASSYKIENSLKSAATQGAEVAILIQNTKAMTKEYVKDQISMYLTHAKGNERGNLKEVIVVGLSGNVHRHKL